MLLRCSRLRDRGESAVDAARFLRSALHGFVALEIAGGFAMAPSTDRASTPRWPASTGRSLGDC